MAETAERSTSAVARWAVGGFFLEAFANRDFDRMTLALSGAVRLRALLPTGPSDWQGARQVAGVFRSWFGDAEDFELVDATVGEVGGRLRLSWRVRLRPAPPGSGTGWHVIEQQAYADAGDTIEVIDLLSSGFHPERGRGGDADDVPRRPC